MKKTVVFLEQQSWLGGAQRVLEATLDVIASEYECLAAFPDKGPFRETLDRKRIKTIDLPIGIYRPGAKSPAKMISFACRSLYCGFKLAAFIRKRRVDLVYINGPRCLPAGVLAALLTRKPTIFHLHLILARRLETLLVARLSRFVTQVLACSHAAAASLVKRDRRLVLKTKVLYNPLRQSLSSSREPHRPANPNHFTIGIVGRITAQKGHHRLLEAVAKLPMRLRSMVRILIVGSGAPDCADDDAYCGRLRSEAARLGLQDQVLWAGYQADPGHYYRSMDVLVHPATDEAMGIAILEALDRGIPVIAARSGGIPEVVRDGFNGLLVSLKEPDALFEALVRFLDHRSVRDHLGSGAGRGLDARFSMETFSSKMRATVGHVCPLT